MNRIALFRTKINEVDDEILILLKKRIQLVEKIGEIKLEESLPIIDDVRYKKILLRIEEKAENLGLSKDMVGEIWELIHKESVKIEKNI